MIRSADDGVVPGDSACGTTTAPCSAPLTEASSREAAAHASPASSSSSARASADAEVELQRVHLLPIGEVDPALASKPRLEIAAGGLRRLRAENQVLSAGDIVRHATGAINGGGGGGEGGADFALIKCEPERGRLGMDTDYYFDGDPVAKFEKIQFSAWGPTEMSSDQIFAEYVGPYFKGESGPYGSPDSTRVRLFYRNQEFQIGDIHFQVEATEPAGLGVVTTRTEIFTVWDQTPEFEKVHIVPFQDTLPRAYEFDVFQDYLRPYLVSHKHKKFSCNELFTYHGVQFKLVAAQPSVVARIGSGTTIYCEGTLPPNIRNLLPPELLSQVAQLPVGLQILLLSTERTTRELEDIMSQRRGLFPDTLQRVERFTWPPSDEQESSQQTCMICLGDFAIGDACRRLPCRHVFHSDCVEEWLRRCTDCPICKDNVDRAIRQY